MKKTMIVKILTLSLLYSIPSWSFVETNPFSKISYSFTRDQNKPASNTLLTESTKTFTDSGLVSLETDGFGKSPIEWADQIWVSPDFAQAMFIKFDLKPQDETVLGKLIKYQDSILIHGRKKSGTYFALFFKGFDEKTANQNFDKILNDKIVSSKSNFQQIFSISTAYAEQTTSACGSTTKGVVKNLFSVVKENKWTCVKNFVKNASGGILGVISNTVLGVMTGDIWSHIGGTWNFVTSVISAIKKTTTALKELDYLPEKTRAEFVCQALGKGAKSAAGALSSGLTGVALSNAVSRFINQITNELYNSSTYKKIIADNKIKQQAFCSKPSNNSTKAPFSGANAVQVNNNEETGSNRAPANLGK